MTALHFPTALSCNQTQACQCPAKKKRWLVVLEKASLIAVAIFSAVISLKLFLPFLFSGMCLGMYLSKHRQGMGTTNNSSSCSLSALEQMSGVNMPPVVSLAINIATLVCHIEHHRKIFVPIVGLAFGAWIGYHVANILQRGYITA